MASSTLDLFPCISRPARQALLVDSASLSSAPTPQFVLRDTVRIRVRFLTIPSGSRVPVNFDPGAGVTINFGAKVAATYPTSTTFLFFNNSFTRDATDPADVFFFADVNLNTTEFIAAFTGGANTLAMTGEIEIESGTERQTVAQFAATGVFDVIRGTEAPPSDAVPPYPVAPSALALLGGNSDGTAWDFFEVADFQSAPRVVGGGTIEAAFDEVLHVIATSTITDPAGAPQPGRGFTVVVRSGTATVGGVAYAVEGTVIRRIWHSGAWANQVDLGAVAATADQRGTVPGIGGSVGANAARLSDLDQVRPPCQQNSTTTILTANAFWPINTATYTSGTLALAPILGDGRTITELSIVSSAAASGLTLAKMAIYKINDWVSGQTPVFTGVSRVGETASFTTIGANSLVTAALDTPVVLTRGAKYYVGILQVGTTPATLRAVGIGDGFARSNAPQSLRIDGLSDLPSDLSGATTTSFGVPLVRMTLVGNITTT